MRKILFRVGMILGLLVTALAAFPAPTTAETYYGCPTDVTALMSAIAEVGSGGIVSINCNVTYTLSSEIELGSVTIDSNGHAVVFDGNHATRIFTILDGADVRLVGLSIINGHSKSGSGIFVKGDAATLTISDSTLEGNKATSTDSTSFGGAIYSLGTLNITGSTLRDNFASRAGAVYARGKMTVTNSTINNNTGWYTSAIFATDQIIITNSTISGNSASATGAAVTIYSPNSRISNSTIAYNSAPSNGTGVHVSAGGSVTVSNTILVSTSGTNCSIDATTGTYTNGGGNIATDASCPGSFVVIPELLHLGPLANNGGSTQTHALLEGSVAIRAGLLSVCNNADVKGIDQREYVRNTIVCDVGAFDTLGVEDYSAPDITLIVDPVIADGTNYWYRSDVSVNWIVIESESPGTAVIEGCVNQILTTDSPEAKFICNATSVGGVSYYTLIIRRDATPPAVAVTGVTDGATYTPGTVPVAGCSTTDATSGVATNATLSTSGGPFGDVTVTCSGAVDKAGNSGSASVTYTVADITPPDIDSTLNPATPNGQNGWYTSDVTLTWTVTETQTPDSLSLTGCENQSVTADQAKTTYSCTATSDGGTSGPVDVVIGRDATPPVVAVTGVTDGATYLYGSVPTAGCSTTDATSGVATVATLTSAGGPVTTITATCAGAADNAGNTAAPVSATYTVLYDWQGFTTAADGPRGPRKVLAGVPITVMFSIGGNAGLDAVESITTIACNAAPGTQPTSAQIAGPRGQLQMGPGGTFRVQLLTSRSWANTCQLVQINLADGTTHEMLVQFLR